MGRSRRRRPRAAVRHSALKRCEERGGQTCTLHVVNNYTVTGQDWRELVPARAADAPDIGRLRPEPYWSMRGPRLAAGLIVWSHGYMAGKNSTDSAPQPWIGRFTRLGYDLYRFDREWIADWASDATSLAAAVRKAREMGYRRVVLAGQSAGAWVSLAALARGAPVDGVISIAAAHHGEVIKMRDQTRARAEWQQVIEGLKPGARILIVNFAEDAYDVGGRMGDARSILTRAGVDALVVDDPAGLQGPRRRRATDFARKFGPCMRIVHLKGDETGALRLIVGSRSTKATSRAAQLGSCLTDATHEDRPGVPFACFRYADARTIAPTVVAER